ncbi:uncharacterized protein EpC_20770 [Erwinia pyrifoliae Ep1/96]|nr:uncharacterized protein EpC_20770 [Erwinia pyrifoliae Ep1/96]
MNAKRAPFTRISTFLPLDSSAITSRLKRLSAVDILTFARLSFIHIRQGGILGVLT